MAEAGLRWPARLPRTNLALGVNTLPALVELPIVGVVAWGTARRAHHSRIIIEQAKGVLAQQGDLSMDAAFDRLRRYARHNNLRLSDVARRVVDTDLATNVLAAASTTGPGPKQR